MVIISYQGEPGAYSLGAAREIVKRRDATDVNKISQHTFIGRESFEDVFRDVANGDSTFGVIPIENTLGGSIHVNYDNLLRYNSECETAVSDVKSVYIHTDHDFRVRHCLLVLPGVKKEDIKRVISHPQALA